MSQRTPRELQHVCALCLLARLSPYCVVVPWQPRLLALCCDGEKCATFTVADSAVYVVVLAVGWRGGRRSTRELAARQADRATATAKSETDAEPDSLLPGYPSPRPAGRPSSLPV